MGSWKTRPRPVLGQPADVATVQNDLPAVEREDARDAVEQRGLAGAVATDDGDEVAGLEVEVDTGERGLLVDRALVEGLGDTLED